MQVRVCIATRMGLFAGCACSGPRRWCGSTAGGRESFACGEGLDDDSESLRPDFSRNGPVDSCGRAVFLLFVTVSRNSDKRTTGYLIDEAVDRIGKIQDTEWNQLKRGGTVQEITISITRHILPLIVIVLPAAWLIKRRKRPPSAD